MGCTSARGELSTIEEEYFKPFEMSLNLNKNYSKDIDRVFYRFAHNKFLNIHQLQQACLKLDLPFDIHHGFLTFFVVDGKYSARKLSTLGVLLGKGSTEEKSALLFENYDEDLSNSLESSEIISIIQDVLEISLYFIPQHVSLLHNDDDLKKVLRKTRLTLSYFSKILFEDIIGDKNNISKIRFIERIEKSCKGFLETQTNRLRCCLAYNKQIEPHEELFKMYDSQAVNQNKTLQRFFTMVNSHDAVRRNTKEQNQFDSGHKKTKSQKLKDFKYN